MKVARVAREELRVTWRCTEPFCVFRDGVPEVYTSDQEVLDDDPILKTHRAYFEPAAARVLGRRVEQTTADPGVPRSVTLVPVPPVEEKNS